MLLGIVALAVGALIIETFVSSRTDKNREQNGLALSDEYLSTHHGKDSVAYAVATQSLVKNSYNR